MEQWKGLMEVTAEAKLVYDVSPLEGQNQFIDLEGQATPNIGDQLLMHSRFEHKKVPMTLDDLRAEAVSIVTLEEPALDLR